MLADVIAAEREFNRLVDACSIPADTPVEAFLKSQESQSAVLKAIAAETARLTVSQQRRLTC
jgi:hypothetical protein